MNIERILAMPDGPALDKAVHSNALFRPGRAPKYSTDLHAAVGLLDLLPIFAARISPNEGEYDEKKPFVAGVLAWNSGLKTYQATTRIKCATLPMAICKAALISTLQPVDQKRVVQTAPAVPKLGSRAEPRRLEPMPTRTLAVKLPPMPSPEPKGGEEGK